LLIAKGGSRSGATSGLAVKKYALTTSMSGAVVSRHHAKCVITGVPGRQRGSSVARARELGLLAPSMRLRRRD
jgi:hypothetical protein